MRCSVSLFVTQSPISSLCFLHTRCEAALLYLPYIGCHTYFDEIGDESPAVIIIIVDHVFYLKFSLLSPHSLLLFLLKKSRRAEKARIIIITHVPINWQTEKKIYNDLVGMRWSHQMTDWIHTHRTWYTNRLWREWCVPCRKLKKSIHRENLWRKSLTFSFWLGVHTCPRVQTEKSERESGKGDYYYFIGCHHRQMIRWRMNDPHLSLSPSSLPLSRGISVTGDDEQGRKVKMRDKTLSKHCPPSKSASLA